MTTCGDRYVLPRWFTCTCVSFLISVVKNASRGWPMTEGIWKVPVPAAFWFSRTADVLPCPTSCELSSVPFWLIDWRPCVKMPMGFDIGVLMTPETPARSTYAPDWLELLIPRASQLLYERMSATDPVSKTPIV